MEGSNSCLTCFNSVILALCQCFTAFVTNTCNLCGQEQLVVCCAAFRTAFSCCQSFQHHFIGCADVYNMVKLYHILQLFSLYNRTRETIQDKTLRAIVFFDSFLYNSDNQFIGNQAACCHNALCLIAQLCAFCNFLSQHVACGNVSNAIMLYQSCSLCPFTCCGCADQY